MKKYITYIITLYCTVCAQAQTLTIHEQKTNQPLEMVVISSENPKGNVLTDANGQADISVFKGSEKLTLYLLDTK